MKRSDPYRKLLAELSRDPRLKRIIAKTRRGRGRINATTVDSATSVFVLLSTIAARFSKKKRARTIEELADIIQLLVQVSLLLKENVFDRPEVKRFFRQRSRQLYELAQGCLSMILQESAPAAAIPPKSPSRPIRPSGRDSTFR